MNGFRDRVDAGRKLAVKLQPYASEHPIVLGLPRGGVPVAYEIAHALRAPLDLWVVRKVGVPWHPELGIGAVAEGPYRYINEQVAKEVGIGPSEIADLVKSKEREVDERVRQLRGDRLAPRLRDRTVIVVDDGIATGGTVRAAVRSIRTQWPRAIVLAVPVAAPETVRVLASEVERLLCLRMPDDLYAIGLWYEDFNQVSDDEVVRLIDRARRELAQAAGAPALR